MYIYILNYTYGKNHHSTTDGIAHSSAYSTLELAKEREERDRNKEINSPPEWIHYDTDQEGVEQWNTTYKLYNGDTGYITITKYPLDAFPNM